MIYEYGRVHTSNKALKPVHILDFGVGGDGALYDTNFATKNCLIKFRNHLTGGKCPQCSAVSARRTGRVFSSKGGKIFTSGNQSFQFVAFFF